jgi:3-(3-hydroxy-phenyl)propionate hydroxylase
MAPGTPCADAPVRQAGAPTWLLPQLGDGFVVLRFGGAPGPRTLSVGAVSARVLQVGSDIVDEEGILSERYDAQADTCYLIRPDQHVAARWRRFEPAKIEAALRRCLALN